MPRKTIQLDEKLVQSIIAKLESEKTYGNRGALFDETVRVLVKEHGFTTFSSAVISQRISKWPNFIIKTKKGARGSHLKSGNADALKQWRETGESKKAKVGDCSHLIESFTRQAKGRFLKVAKSIKRGSLKAAIRGKCLDCANFQTEEIKQCQCFDCPLWPIRPYQINLNEELE